MYFQNNHEFGVTLVLQRGSDLYLNFFKFAVLFRLPLQGIKGPLHANILLPISITTCRSSYHLIIGISTETIRKCHLSTESQF